MNAPTITTTTNYHLMTDEGVRLDIASPVPEPVGEIVDCGDGRWVYLADDMDSQHVDPADLEGWTLTELNRGRGGPLDWNDLEPRQYPLMIGGGTQPYAYRADVPDPDSDGDRIGYATHVLTLDDDWTDPDAAVAGFLTECGAWMRGEVYGVVELVPVEGSIGGRLDIGDSCWGFIGWEYACGELASWAGSEVR
jgi:hypothetical protein